MRAERLTILLALLVLVTGALAYYPGLSGPMLFDDKPAMSANEAVQIHGGVLDEWRVAAFSSGSGPLRRPVSMLSFAGNYVVQGGFFPFGVKLVNLFIHLAISALLYKLFNSVLEALAIGRDAGKRRLIALTGAAIWLLHPLHVSTVLYAVQRMAQLSTLFAVAGLLLFVRYRRRWAEYGAQVGEVAAAVLWLLLLTALAALSKENGALLPWLVVVLEVAVFRGRWAGQRILSLQAAGWVLLGLPVVLVIALLAWYPEPLISGYASREFTLSERLLTQVRLLWRYVGWILVPNINDMGFQHDDIPLSQDWLSPATTLLAVLGWGAALIVSLKLRGRYPLFLLAVLFFLVGHSMESSVLPLEMVYEHRNYLPDIFICLGMSTVLVLVVSRTGSVNIAYPVGGVLIVLGVLLFLRAESWSDELILSRTNLAQHPESSRSNYFYANALLRHYRQRESLGLDEQEAGDSLLLSRHFFERMYQTNERDAAALVMLYYLDSQFFPQLQARVDWFSELETLLESRTLQPSDWNALETLFECLAAGTCEAGPERVTGLLDTLALRYPRAAAVDRFRYRYLQSRGAAPEELLPILQRVEALDPAAAWTHYHLLYEQAQNHDIAEMYDQARRWMQSDPKRQHLHQLKDLFTDTDAGAESSDG